MAPSVNKGSRKSFRVLRPSHPWNYIQVPKKPEEGNECSSQTLEPTHLGHRARARAEASAGTTPGATTGATPGATTGATPGATAGATPGATAGATAGAGGSEVADGAGARDVVRGEVSDGQGAGAGAKGPRNPCSWAEEE